jgi:hypothetical protein
LHDENNHIHILTLPVVAGCTGVSAQAGCGAKDLLHLTSLEDSLMKCVGLNLLSVSKFVLTLSSEQKKEMELCTKNNGAASDDACMALFTSLSQMAADKPDSLPGKVVNTIYNNPPGTLSCLADLGGKPFANGYSDTCKDGQMAEKALKVATRASHYIGTIQPWTFPPELSGCSEPDLVHIELASLPFLSCLHLNATNALSMAKTYSGKSIQDVGSIVQDSTISAALSCLYTPHMSNAECQSLIKLASQKVEVLAGTSDITKAVLSDYPQACTCVAGISKSAAFSAVSTQCKARDLLLLLEALDTGCSTQAAVSQALSDSLVGCSDADVLHASLVGVQVGLFLLSS